jgi:hypothetical protein
MGRNGQPLPVPSPSPLPPPEEGLEKGPVAGASMGSLHRQSPSCEKERGLPFLLPALLPAGRAGRRKARPLLEGRQRELRDFLPSFHHLSFHAGGKGVSPFLLQAPSHGGLGEGPPAARTWPEGPDGSGTPRAGPAARPAPTPAGFLQSSLFLSSFSCPRWGSGGPGPPPSPSTPVGGCLEKARMTVPHRVRYEPGGVDSSLPSSPSAPMRGGGRLMPAPSPSPLPPGEGLEKENLRVC